MTVVRFSLISNGLLYGTGADAPRSHDWRRDGPPRTFRVAPTDMLGEWVFNPPALPPRFIDDFQELVEHFGRLAVGHRSFAIRLIPVLIGFNFVENPYAQTVGAQGVPYATQYVFPRRNYDRRGRYVLLDDRGYVVGRRGDALSDDALAINQSETKQSRFLRLVLGELLGLFDQGRPLYRLRGVIHSWDLFGEPEHCTAPRDADPTDLQPVTWENMRSYLAHGIEQVARANFDVTIGFDWHTTSMDLPNSPRYRRQFHYYPRPGRTLPRVGPTPPILGEVATHPHARFDPDYFARYGTSAQGVSLSNRLEWLEHKGYREVLLWSGSHAPRDPDNHPEPLHSWGPTEHNQVRAFVGGRRLLGL